MRIVLSILFLFFTAIVQGQTLHGRIVDSESLKPLNAVAILDLANSRSVITDGDGNFEIPAKNGDVISFSLIGYRNTQRITDPQKFMNVQLKALSVKLQEFILHPDSTKFQKDSAEIVTLYSKELNKKPIKTGFSSANGGGFTGLIGGPVQKLSKSYKQNKKFKQNVKSDLEQKYIDTRYTEGLVTAITGFSGDTLAIFMNNYPMEYGFARAASDLEIKMWIRNNYKDYLHKQSSGK